MFAAFAGGNGIKFLKQYNEYGLKAKIPLLGAMTTVDEGVLKSMGDEALGVVSAGWYTATHQQPEQQALRRRHQPRLQAGPGLLLDRRVRRGADAGRGAQGVKGKIEDKAAFMAALRKVQVANDPRGTISLDALGNPVMDVYIRKVERKDGKLVNSHRQDLSGGVASSGPTARASSWPTPVYSRDYPPAKNLEK